jgi:hypothetical protein
MRLYPDFLDASFPIDPLPVHAKFTTAMNQQELPARGMPKWREKQRNLPVEEKIALLGQTIQETLAMERIKKVWKPSVASSQNSLPKK